MANTAADKASRSQGNAVDDRPAGIWNQSDAAGYPRPAAYGLGDFNRSRDCFVLIRHPPSPPAFG